MKSGFSQKGTLAVVCLATAMLMLDIAVVNTALSHIASDLHSSLTGLRWIVDAYTLALATVVLTAGSLADRLGRRLIFAWGMGIFTATSLWCAVADLDRRARRRSGRPGHRRGDDVRQLACRARRRVSGRGRARQGVRRLRCARSALRSPSARSSAAR